MIRKTNKAILIASTIILVSLNGIASYANGPGEINSAESEKVNIITYYQNTVRTLGNWEQQQDGYWKFKQTVGGQYLTNSWIESLSEVGSFYYVNNQEVMVTSCTTPDGYNVDASGLWKTTAVPNPNVPTAPSAPTNNGSNSNVNKDDYTNMNDYYRDLANKIANDPVRQKELADKTVGESKPGLH